MCIGHVMHTLRTQAVASRLLRILPQRLPFSLTTSTVYALNHVVAAMIRLKRLIHDNTSRWVWQSNIYPTIYESTQLKITNYSEWYPTWSLLTPANIMINALFRGIFFSSIVGWPSIEIYPGPHHVWVPKYTVCTMLYIGFKIKNEIGFKRNGKWRMFNAFNIVCSLNDHASSFRSSHLSAVHLLLERGCEETDQSVTWV